VLFNNDWSNIFVNATVALNDIANVAAVVISGFIEYTSNVVNTCNPNNCCCCVRY
jgi:hypothetical protein